MSLNIYGTDIKRTIVVPNQIVMQFIRYLGINYNTNFSVSTTDNAETVIFWFRKRLTDKMRSEIVDHFNKTKDDPIYTTIDI